MVQRPAGHLIATDLFTGNTTVQDTVQCGHCQRHQVIGPRQPVEELGGFCYHCTRFVCDRCVGKPCLPKEEMHEKEMRELERKLERDRYYGIFRR